MTYGTTAALAGVPFSRIVATFGERSVAPINAGIDAIRREFTAAPAGVG